MKHILYLWTAVLISVHSVYMDQNCYRCSPAAEGPCSTPEFDGTTILTQMCTGRCNRRKVRTGDGLLYVTRSCHPATDDFPLGCMRGSLSDHSGLVTISEECRCDTDLCNDERDLNLPSTLTSPPTSPPTPTSSPTCPPTNPPTTPQSESATSSASRLSLSFLNTIITHLVYTITGFLGM